MGCLAENSNFGSFRVKVMSGANFSQPPDATVMNEATSRKSSVLWLRWAARTFDLLLAQAVIATPVMILIGAYDPRFLYGANYQGQLFWLALASIPFALMLDALIYAGFGNTLGKALAGISVTKADGQRLAFGSYLRRNMRLWVSGLGLGFPIVSAISELYQYRQVKHHGYTGYDLIERYNVTRRPGGFLKLPIFFVCFVVVFVFDAGAMNNYSQHGAHSSLGQSTGTTASSFKRIQAPRPTTFLWTNPSNGLSASIDGYWSLHELRNNDNQPIAQFVATGIFVLFAAEKAPTMNLNDYVNAFRSNNRAKMTFTNAGQFGEFNGNPDWAAAGQINADKQSLVLSVVIVQRGDTFYRTVSAWAPSFTDPAHEYTKLQKALWSTVGSH